MSNVPTAATLALARAIGVDGAGCVSLDRIAMETTTVGTALARPSTHLAKMVA